MPSIADHDRQLTSLAATLFLFSSTLCSSTPAMANDLTVFGFPLGAKFEVPECEKIRRGRNAIASEAPQPCFERMGGPGLSKQIPVPVVSDSVLVKFPLNDRPSLIKGDTIVAMVVDGNLEGIEFNTSGVSVQERTIQRLKEKYGEPSIFWPYAFRNRRGATHQVFDARWSTPELEIVYHSVTETIDSGLVNIDTKKGSAQRAELLKKLTEEKRPL